MHYDLNKSFLLKWMSEHINKFFLRCIYINV